MVIKIECPSAIILDIEGTTTDISYVSQVLFPFIKTHLKKFLNESWTKDEVIDSVQRLRIFTENEQKNGVKLPTILSVNKPIEEQIKSVIANVLWQMEEKRGNAELQQIQILVWVYGYEKEYLKGHVFNDVPKAMHFWKNDHKIKIYIYSTGMVAAQKLLFSCSNHGNLLPLIDKFFDNSIGAKTDPKSFITIAETIEEHPSKVLFLTDNPKEAAAAKSAGCKVIIMARPGNRPLSVDDRLKYQISTSFEDIQFK